MIVERTNPCEPPGYHHNYRLSPIGGCSDLALGRGCTLFVADQHDYTTNPPPQLHVKTDLHLSRGQILQRCRSDRYRNTLLKH